MRHLSSVSIPNALRIFALLISAATSYLSWIELSYAYDGQVTTAAVTRDDPYVVRQRGTSTWLKIEYCFTDSSGAGRRESVDIPREDFEPAVGSIIQVQYRPAPGWSRPLGHDHRMQIVIGLCVLSAGLILRTIYRAVGTYVSSRESLFVDGMTRRS
jgi:hypothetical protein